MEYSLIVVIGVGLAAMFFGYFFGLNEGRGQGYRKRKKEEEVEKAGKVSLEAMLPPPSPPAASIDNSLLRLSVDEKDQPQLDLDGQHVDAAALPPEQRKRLIDLMLIMRPWVEGGAAPRSAAPAKPASQPIASRPAAQTPVSQPRAIPVAAAPLASAAPEVAPNSMVGQINAILQLRLIGTPLANQGVRLVESAEGGAIVIVGQKRYSGVADVTEPEVQSAIRAAIAEWEKRYTPG
jgi:hypothetical protein